MDFLLNCFRSWIYLVKSLPCFWRTHTNKPCHSTSETQVTDTKNHKQYSKHQHTFPTNEAIYLHMINKCEIMMTHSQQNWFDIPRDAVHKLYLEVTETLRVSTNFRLLEPSFQQLGFQGGRGGGLSVGQILRFFSLTPFEVTQPFPP